jgi:prepilin-type N-terminal cleavage/methylation domain-containing protein
MRRWLGKKSDRRGFTLIEIMIVVAVIALLAAIAIPSFLKARRRSRATKVASSLRVFGDGFIQYNLERGAYPDDTDLTLPDGMEDYIKQQDWDAGALGGNYNWDGPSYYPYAGIALVNITADQVMLEELDTVMDDGDMATGKLRITPNGRYTYIFEE